MIIEDDQGQAVWMRTVRTVEEGRQVYHDMLQRNEFYVYDKRFVIQEHGVEVEAYDLTIKE